MSGFHKQKERFKFTERRHSKPGIAAFILALILILCYGIFILLSYKSEGQLSVYYGCAGVFCMVLSVTNLVPAILGLLDENSFPIYPRLALLLDGVAMLLWIGTYVKGF